jgi:hypothetical protein
MNQQQFEALIKTGAKFEFVIHSCKDDEPVVMDIFDVEVNSLSV